MAISEDVDRERDLESNRALDGSEQRNESPVRIPNNALLLARTALALGAATILLSLVVGTMAYRYSRSAMLDIVADQNLAMSQTVVKASVAMLELMTDLGGEPQPLLAVEKAWQGTVAPIEGSYLCVIGSTGDLKLHTSKPEMVGTNVGQMIVDQRPGKKVMTVVDLLQAKTDYGGLNWNFRGTEQLAGFAWFEPMNGMVVVHIPVSRLDAQIRAGALPWGISLGVLTGCLFPLALLLLHTSYVRAERVSKVAKESLANSERRLEEQLAELELVYRLSPVGLCFVDTELRIVRINDELAAINRPTVAEHLGQTIGSVLPEIADVIEPVYRSVIETGNSVLNIEVARPSTDGSGEIRHYVTNYFLVPDFSGKALGVCAVVLDITNQNSSEKTIRESEQQFQRLLASLEDVVWSATPDGQFQYLNQAVETIYGLSVEKCRSNPNFWLESVVPEDIAIAEQSSVQLQNEGVTELEYRIRRPDGSIHWLLDRKYLVKDGNDIVSIGGIATDITERKNAEQALRSSIEENQKLADEMAFVARQNTMIEMAGGISHELNQPIGAIANFAAVCVQHLNDHETKLDRKFFDHIKRIHTIAHEAGQIIQRMREFTQRQSAPASRLGLEELIRTTLEMMQFRIRRNRILAKLNFPENEAFIIADVVGIRQVIVNVIQNAIDSIVLSGDGSRELTISLEAQERTAVILFHDQGIGIPVDQLDGLFESGLTTKPKGSGIGLAICNRIMIQHRGSIVCWNNDDRGATFRMTLPLEEEPALTA
jgi:PAS domain S-box-containing protein